MAGKIETLKEMMTVAAAEAMEPLGYVRYDYPDPAGGVYFAARDRGMPDVVPIVRMGLDRHSRGGLEVFGSTDLLAPRVGEVFRTMPSDALLERDVRDGQFLDVIESKGFDTLVGSTDSSVGRPMLDAAGVGAKVEWFTRVVAHQAADWFGKRDSMAKLIDLAQYSPPGVTPKRVGPRRLRAMVVLCLLNEASDTAVALMEWYLGLDSYMADTAERVAAFDVALRERFPEYAQRRTR